MRKDFEWYFPASEAEVHEIWSSGILTLDTNVLLDLYRYHEGTRNEILRTLQAFKGRLWVSRQAAEEFFRNRAKVIVGSTSGFKQAQEDLAKLDKAITTVVEQLRGNRIIPATITAELEAVLTAGLDNANKNIDQAKSTVPNYLEKDPVLDELLALFDDAVGPPFTEDQRAAALAEAERRKKLKIPPGYLDEEKDGERSYGDYFVWRQILEHSKNAGMSMILVTSERKEDWWERPSGRTVGPRQELLKEAHEYAGHRLLIYQTDRFLQLAATASGKKVDESAVQEIRAVSQLVNLPAVKVRSQTESRDESTAKGFLFVMLQRAIPSFTASGHFDPPLPAVPSMDIRLVETPEDCPSVSAHCRTGTNHDFNVHVKIRDGSERLPVGEYVFEYAASWGNVEQADQ